MLQIKNLTIGLTTEKKTIVNNVNLTIKEGEIHFLNGENGSGKSSLVNLIMGNPSLKIETGEILLDKKDYSEKQLESIPEETFNGDKIVINNLDPNLRSHLGIYLANQYPVEIPGVQLTNYLRLIFNASKDEEENLPLFKFKKLLEETALKINYPKYLLERNLNEGFSGGEKKKTEILQMLLLKPRYVMLDEIDSGLDRKSVVDVFSALKTFKEENPKASFLIISHYDKVQEFLKPDFIHEMSKGRLVS